MARDSPSQLMPTPIRPPFRYQYTEQPRAATSSSISEKAVDEFRLDEKVGHASRDIPVQSTDRHHPQRSAPRDSHRSSTRHPTDSRSHQVSLENYNPYRSSRPHRVHSHPPPANSHNFHSSADADSECCGVSLSGRVKASLPILAWVATSLGFLLAIGFWKEEVFIGLEQLSDWIRTQGYYGQAILFSLIFLTTFPPVPLYSTLIVLSGYCLGAYQGAIISYFAALGGAVAVFALSRTYFRSSIAGMITHAPASVKRAIRAVEKQPKLLFLIRLSPYPYNLMNALLATSRISFSTYTLCTALSLFKVLVHTTIGASIHKFSEYHTHPSDGDSTESGNDEGDSDMSRTWTILGVVLCVALLVYLSWVARRAVDDIEDEEDGFGLPTPTTQHRSRAMSASRYHSRNGRPPISSHLRRDSDECESVAFLSPAAQDDSRRPSADFSRVLNSAADMNMMSESPFRGTVPLRVTSPFRMSDGYVADRELDFVTPSGLSR